MKLSVVDNVEDIEMTGVVFKYRVNSRVCYILKKRRLAPNALKNHLQKYF